MSNLSLISDTAAFSVKFKPLNLISRVDSSTGSATITGLIGINQYFEGSIYKVHSAEIAAVKNMTKDTNGIKYNTFLIKFFLIANQQHYHRAMLDLT